MAIRTLVKLFETANPLYASAVVSFYTVDANGAKTTTLATLYTSDTGTDFATNPATLTPEGKLPTPVYASVAVIGSIVAVTVANHDTGVFYPQGGATGDWATSTLYYPNDIFRAGASADASYDVYAVKMRHTSGTFATDLAAGKLQKLVDISDIASLLTLGTITPAWQTVIDDATIAIGFETIRTALSAKTVPAVDDEFYIRDTAGATGKRMTFQNYLKVISALTEDTAPDIAADFFLSYDASAAGVKKVSPKNTAFATASLLSNVVMYNGTLVASVAANALTIALKTLAGTDPSATDPVYILFRSATATSGTYSVLTITAAASVVVSSTSTLGTSNGVPARIWIVAFNDGGTFRLGVVNCSNATNIFPLSDDMLATSVAEGGAGAADSAGIIYTGTAVSAKAMRILGYLEATEATAGTWATAPSKLQLWTPGMKLPGDTIQRELSISTSMSTGVTAIPNDNTVPQSTEGNQYLTVTITPTSAINHLEIEADMTGTHSADVRYTGAIFQDAILSAIVSDQAPRDAAAAIARLHLIYQKLAGQVTAMTFNLRAGGDSGATFTFNGQGGGAWLGGVISSRLLVTELMG